MARKSESTNNHEATRHIRFGVWSLLIFLTLGLVLETFHAFKIQWYLEEGNVTRRLMGTLAHSHGTLLALVNIVAGILFQVFGDQLGRTARMASPCLISSAILLPSGFLLGGIVIYAGDPGLGILLVPVGGLVLLAGVLLMALAIPNQGHSRKR